jgi:uncharacterized protein YndB with AHSA1/START domain
MIDIVREIEAVQRSVGEAPLGDTTGRSVRMRREYDAALDDVWDAVTNPERIGRWFLPISGDFRLGGSYQFEGNAGGRIVACERPSRLRVTWVYGPPSDAPDSEVEVRLASVGPDRTALELEHVAVVPDEFWDQFGPGAVGVGWDGGLLGLTLHLRSGAGVDDPIAWQVSPEGIAFFTASSDSWGAASRAAGVPADVVARQVAATTTFYTVDPSAAAPEA